MERGVQGLYKVDIVENTLKDRRIHTKIYMNILKTVKYVKRDWHVTYQINLDQDWV